MRSGCLEREKKGGIETGCVKLSCSWSVYALLGRRGRVAVGVIFAKLSFQK